jgi:threonyl-tRNA synthetase
MIHRAVLGSLERFCGGLIEHYAGVFPTWLAPIQVAVLPISDRHQEYAKGIFEELKDLGFRCELDDRSETINYRIRESQNKQIPYMLILGDKEVEASQVAIRHRRNGNMGAMSLPDFLELITREIQEKA